VTTVSEVVDRIVMGPSWTRDDDGRFILPERSLGWAAIDWAEEHILQPDGPDAGDSWRFSKEQKRLILWWYAIDERGRFLFDRGMLRRMKGWGKDPFGAVICLIEFVGPCRFGGWDASGDPIVVPYYAACVQIAAVSGDQVKRNTMSLFPAMISPAMIREHEMDVGKEIIYAYRGRCRIELLTSSSRSTEGPRPSFILKNESQHWIASNGGDDMAEVCARNVAKSRDGAARMLAIANAHALGEGSDAELDYEAYQLHAPRFFYDSIEASPVVRDKLERLKKATDLPDAERDALRGELIGELEWCRGDSVWLDVERLLSECETPQTKLSMALRFYFNVLAAEEDRAFDRDRWAQLAKPLYKAEPRALIVAGFDGSVSNDHTALIATEVATGHQWVAGYWEPRLIDGEFRIPIAEVNAAVADLFDRYDVWRLNCDPYYWREQIDAWAGRWNTQDKKPIVSWDTTRLKQTAVALLTYHNAIMAREVTHDGDEKFTACIQNAYRQEQYFVDDNGEKMWTIRKERQDSPLKIDAAMAGMLSWEARSAAVAAGMLDKSEYAGVYFA